MKSSILFFGLFSLIINTSFASDKGNGGFIYSRTSKKLLDVAQISLLNELKLRQESGLADLYSSPSCPISIDLRVVESQVKNLDYSYTESSVGINTDGVEEPRFFDSKDHKIRATKDFFESFVESYFRFEEGDQAEKDLILKRVRIPILHEILHDLGYDESAARVCAPDVEAGLSMSDARKLTALQKQITHNNDDLVLRHMEKFCLSEIPELPVDNKIYQDVTSSQRLLSCVVKHDKGMLKVNPKQRTGDIILAMADLMSKSTKKEDLARYLNSVVVFSFETKVPTLR